MGCGGSKQQEPVRAVPVVPAGNDRSAPTTIPATKEAGQLSKVAVQPQAAQPQALQLSLQDARKAAPEVANWVLQIQTLPDDVRETVLIMLVEQDITNLDLLTSLTEDSFAGLEKFEKLTLGMKAKVKKAFKDLVGATAPAMASAHSDPSDQTGSHHAGTPAHQNSLDAHPPLNAVDGHPQSEPRGNPPVGKPSTDSSNHPHDDIVDMSSSSVGKVFTTLKELMKSSLNSEELLFGHFTTQTAVRGIREKGFRVSNEGQGAGGFYLVSEEALEVMLASKANKFDRESFLCTAFSLFGPECEKRSADDIAVLLIIKVNKAFVRPVPIDDADERSGDFPTLHYVPNSLVDSMSVQAESDGFHYIPWQGRIIKAYKVFTPENVKGELRLGEAKAALKSRQHQVTLKQQMQAKPQQVAGSHHDGNTVDPNIKYPNTIALDGMPFMLSGWNGEYERDGTKNGRPSWRRSGVVKFGMVPIIPADIWWDSGKNKWILHRDGDSESKAMARSTHSNATPMGKWEAGVTVVAR